MRILFVTAYYKPAYVYGGPARSVSILCEGLAQVGAQVTVFTTNANGPKRLSVPLSRPIDIEGVEVWYFPLALAGLYFYSPALASTIRQRVLEFDLVVVESLWGHAFGPTVSACSRARIPYVVPLRGQLQPWALRRRSLRKRIVWALLVERCLNGAAAFQCTDYSEKEAVRGLGLCPPAFVIPNGIDCFRFAEMPERGQLRRQLGIPMQAVVLLFVGRLVQIKRADIAVSTLAAVRSAGREAYLVLAGPDQEGLTTSLQAQARQLGCSGQVQFAGLLTGDQLLAAFADADLLVMPSEIPENFGMAALEAMVAGVPILVSDEVPVGRWAAMAGAGRVAPCTAVAFAQAAIEMLQSPEQLKTMGERGRKLARERFDSQVVARRVLAQYEAIIATGRPLPE